MPTSGTQHLLIVSDLQYEMDQNLRSAHIFGCLVTPRQSVSHGHVQILCARSIIPFFRTDKQQDTSAAKTSLSPAFLGCGARYIAFRQRSPREDVGRFLQSFPIYIEPSGVAVGT